MKHPSLSIGLLIAVLGTVSAHAATEREAPAPATRAAVADGVQLARLPQYTRALAWDLAGQWNDARFRSLVASRIGADSRHTQLVTLLRDYADTWPSRQSRELADLAALVDRELREAKGIAAHLDELLDLRLATQVGPAGLEADRDVAFLAVPARDERRLGTVEAFDAQRRTLAFDEHDAPARAVLVVDVDAAADLRAGIQVINEGLRAAGLQPEAPSVEATTSIQTSKLTQISMRDDHEPWYKGAAEMYALVAGVDPQFDKASMAAVDMPYLDDANKEYYPNQVVIFWSNYRFAAADILFYEHDSGYDYTQIITIIINAIGTFVPDYQWATTLASQIIQAFPTGTFSDDDDYSDVFYTLERGVTYTGRYGASSNVRLSLVPFLLNP